MSSPGLTNLSPDNKLFYEKNFTLGVAQIGSTFNHSHKALSETYLKQKKYDEISGAFEKIKVFTKDTCIGMMNPQFACNYFETNNAEKSIGYAYTSNNLQSNFLTYGQYSSKSGINGINGHQSVLPSGTYDFVYDILKEQKIHELTNYGITSGENLSATGITTRSAVY